MKKTTFSLLVLISTFISVAQSLDYSLNEVKKFNDGTLLVPLPIDQDFSEYKQVFLSSENLVFIYPEIVFPNTLIYTYSIKENNFSFFSIESSAFDESSDIYIKKIKYFENKYYVLMETDRDEKIIEITRRSKISNTIYNSGIIKTKQRHQDFELVSLSNIYLYGWVSGGKFKNSIAINHYSKEGIKNILSLEHFYAEAFTAFSDNYKCIAVKKNQVEFLNPMSGKFLNIDITNDGNFNMVNQINATGTPTYWKKYLKYYTSKNGRNIFNYLTAMEDDVISSERIKFINDSIFCINHLDYRNGQKDSLVFYNNRTRQHMASVVNDFTFKDTFNTNDFEMYYLYYSPWDVNEDYHVVKQRYSKKIDLLNKSIIAPYFLLNKKKIDYLVVVPNRLKLK